MAFGLSLLYEHPSGASGADILGETSWSQTQHVPSRDMAFGLSLLYEHPSGAPGADSLGKTFWSQTQHVPTRPRNDNAGLTQLPHLNLPLVLSLLALPLSLLSQVLDQTQASGFLPRRSTAGAERLGHVDPTSYPLRAS